MIINADTKIAAILKKDPDALESIISISPMFAKLRNPLLRKLMAGRTSLQMAANMGGCTLQDFYDKLCGPHFEIGTPNVAAAPTATAKPRFLEGLDATNIIELDVRPTIDAGGDPLKVILEKINTIKAGQALKIINSFEPVPLVLLLGKKGFESYTNVIGEKLVETYFFKSSQTGADITIPDVHEQAGDFQTLLNEFQGKMVYVDVRHLEMPLPMTTILEAIENLKPGEALFVYHKRIPVFLLPELADKNLDYRIREIDAGEVHMIIYNSKNVSC